MEEILKQEPVTEELNISQDQADDAVKAYTSKLEFEPVYEYPAINFQPSPPMSKKWKCLLFGSNDFVYIPIESYEPNWFVRLMMRVCLNCRWVKQTH